MIRCGNRRLVLYWVCAGVLLLIWGAALETWCPLWLPRSLDCLHDGLLLLFKPGRHLVLFHHAFVDVAADLQFRADVELVEFVRVQPGNGIRR